MLIHYMLRVGGLIAPIYMYPSTFSKVFFGHCPIYMYDVMLPIISNIFLYKVSRGDDLCEW